MSATSELHAESPPLDGRFSPSSWISLDCSSEADRELAEDPVLQRELLEGVVLFNDSPHLGIKLLQADSLVGPSPEHIARFLLYTRGLDMDKIGLYLGDHSEQCISVMHAYVDLHDFTGLEFDEALRSFLKGFRLPGEAQKIERLVLRFGKRFMECNPDSVINSSDAAFQLAYSLIILHTDAHNPQVKHKMTLQQYLENVRRLPDLASLPDQYLCQLYKRTVSKKFKMVDGKRKKTQSQKAFSVCKKSLRKLLLSQPTSMVSLP